MALLTKGARIPIIPEAAEKAKGKGEVDPVTAKINALSAKKCRTAPSPVVRNPDADKVDLERRVVKPGYTDLLEGLFTGQVKDAKKALTKLDQALDADLDRAIAAAQKKGAQITRDDYVPQLGSEQGLHTGRL